MKQRLFLMLLALNSGVHGVDQSTSNTSWVGDLSGPATKKAVQEALAVQGDVVPQWDKPSVPVAFKGHITKDAPSVTGTELMPGRDVYEGWIKDLLKKSNITQGEADLFRVDLASSERVAEQFGYIFDSFLGGLTRHIKRLRMPVVVHNKSGLFNPKDMLIAASQRCVLIGAPSDSHPEWHSDLVKGKDETRFTSSGFTIHDLIHSVASMDILNDTVHQAIANIVKQADTKTPEGRKALLPLFWLSNEIMPVRHRKFLRVQYDYGMSHALQLSRKELDETGNIDPNKERTGPAGSIYTLNSFSSEIEDFVKNNEIEKIEKRESINKKKQTLEDLLAILKKDNVTHDELDHVEKEWEKYKDTYGLKVEGYVEEKERGQKLKDELSAVLCIVERDMKKFEDKEKNENKWLGDVRGILNARTYDEIDALHKTYTTDPHVYVDSLFDLLIYADKSHKHREDKQQLDAMISWVDPELCQKKDKGADTTYDNWGTFAQWATECKAKVHDEINTICQTKDNTPTDQVSDV